MKKSFGSAILPILMMGTYEPIYPQIGYTSPIYIPKKHTVQSYRSQQKEGKRK
jgi:hypothetical protein